MQLCGIRHHFGTPLISFSHLKMVRRQRLCPWDFLLRRCTPCWVLGPSYSSSLEDPTHLLQARLLFGLAWHNMFVEISVVPFCSIPISGQGGLVLLTVAWCWSMTCCKDKASNMTRCDWCPGPKADYFGFTACSDSPAGPLCWKEFIGSGWADQPCSYSPPFADQIFTCGDVSHTLFECMWWFYRFLSYYQIQAYSFQWYSKIFKDV